MRYTSITEENGIGAVERHDYSFTGTWNGSQFVGTRVHKYYVNSILQYNHSYPNIIANINCTNNWYWLVIDGTSATPSYDQSSIWNDCMNSTGYTQYVTNSSSCLYINYANYTTTTEYYEEGCTGGIAFSTYSSINTSSSIS